MTITGPQVKREGEPVQIKRESEPVQVKKEGKPLVKLFQQKNEKMACLAFSMVIDLEAVDMVPPCQCRLQVGYHNQTGLFRNTAEQDALNLLCYLLL